MSYSTWTDRVAACSFGGELSVLTFSSSYHVTPLYHHYKKKDEFIDKYHKVGATMTNQID